MIVVVTYFSNLSMWAKGSAAVRKREQGGRAKNEPMSSNSPLKKLLRRRTIRSQFLAVYTAVAASLCVS